MKYCCKQIEQLFDEAGNAGLSAIFRRLGDKVGIFLQCRVCDAVQEHKLSSVKNLPQPFRVLVQQGICFCPFCGANVQETLSGLDNQSISELVSKHQSFEL